MADDGKGRSVLVTGTSSGIGAACARALDRRGFRVFAGVRRLEDADRLVAASRTGVTPVLLDVTDGASVAAAREVVEAACGQSGLAGIVNNAGIAVAGPIEHLEMDEWRHQFEVNVVGQLAVTRAFMPLVRQGEGRVVFMGSIAGRVAAPMLGPYAASKHAIEAIADSLRMELAPWAIAVSVVQPGAIKTPIWEKGIDRAEQIKAGLSPQALVDYEGAIDAAVAAAKASDEAGLPPGRVSRAVVHALTAKRPKARYVVGNEARIGMLMQSIAPTRVRDAVLRRRLGI